MSSFFEKLRKGMGVEIHEKETKKAKEKSEKKIPQEPAPKLKTGRVKQVSAKEKEIKKMKIETEPIEMKAEKNEEQEKTKERKEIEQEQQPKEDLQLPHQKFAIKKLASQEGQLAVDVFQTDTELVIRSAIAGMKPDELNISIESDSVIIKGVREQPAEKKEKNYFYQECYWGPFSRQIILPEETDSSRAEASMKEGILTIRIPKIEKEEKKKILIKG